VSYPYITSLLYVVFYIQYTRVEKI